MVLGWLRWIGMMFMGWVVSWIEVQIHGERAMRYCVEIETMAVTLLGRFVVVEQVY